MENVDGVLLVDKDPDMTSHDVVSVARRTLGQKKIGRAYYLFVWPVFRAIMRCGAVRCGESRMMRCGVVW